MKKNSLNFLTELLSTPSPSGFEQKIQEVVKKRASRYADLVEVDVHGNLIASLNPEGKTRVMLAGHCDQIGMMITHICEKGYLYFNQIGGLDPSVIPGSSVVVHSRKKSIAGIIGNTPVHLLSQSERGKRIELKKLWIDIGAKDGAQAKSMVAIGDPVTYAANISNLESNFIASPACDDKVGVFVVMEALRIVAEETKGKKDFPVALFAVSTVQEEIGLRGARTSCYDVDPLVGIAVDVTHASDNPGAEAKQIGTVSLGAGPTIARGANINPVLEEMLIKTAEKSKLPFQTIAAPGATGTDANAMQISRGGVAAALIGIPNRYMHTQVEVVSLDDLENAAKLIAKTVLSIKAKDDFIPA